MSDQGFHFNAIDGAMGDYLLHPMQPEAIVAIVEKDKPHPWDAPQTTDIASPTELVDVADVGWGVIFAHNCDPHIRESLSDVLRLRKQQATSKGKSLYRVFKDSDGYLPGEHGDEFLIRHGIRPGSLSPGRGVPSYLLIVGDFQAIPYQFELELRKYYAVGRICFDTLESYFHYAHSVVVAEEGNTALPRQATFFSPHHHHDPVTQLISERLIVPLATALAESHQAWDVRSLVATNATKSRLEQLIGGNETPSLLVVAGHGVAFPQGHSEQATYQGALLCQDWLGPNHWHGPLLEEFFLSGADVNSQVRLSGLLACLLASFSMGTPATDRLAQQSYRTTLASQPFVAKLPQHLLGGGRALAVVGYMGRMLSFGYPSERLDIYQQVFKHMLIQLLQGYPVGLALRRVHAYGFQLFREWKELQAQAKRGTSVDPALLSLMWLLCNDTLNLTLMGDPAVRLSPNTRNVAKSARQVVQKQPAIIQYPKIPKVPVQVEEQLPIAALVLGTPKGTDVSFGKPAIRPSTILSPVAPSTDNRIVHAWVSDLPKDKPLQLNCTYELKFRIESSQNESGTEGIEKLFVGLDEGACAEVLVLLESEDFTIYGEKQQTLILPHTGPSKNSVTFSLEAKKHGACVINAMVMAHHRPFQKMVLTFYVGEMPTGTTHLAIQTSGMHLERAIALPMQRSLDDINLVILKRGTDYQFILQNGGVMRAQINLSEVQINEMVARARMDLKEIAYTRMYGDYVYMREDTTIPAEIYAMSLKKLAKLGYYLYQRLFYTHGNGPDARAMGDLLRDLSRHRRLTIEIVAEQFVFPWVLLYDRDPLDLDAVDPEGFWGFKHILEYMPEFNRSTLVNFVPEIMVQDTLELGFIYNQAIDMNIRYPVVQKQQQFLQTLPGVHVTEYPNRDQLFALLRNADAPEHILYFYCDAESYLPSEKQTISSSKITLSDGDVTLEDLEVQAPANLPELSRAPLVFLNACQSAELSPYLYHGLVPYLLNRGVRGVIGTEVDTPALFAAEFAQEFLKQFTAGGQTLGALLLTMRRIYLFQKNNVMGLLYALYSSGEIFVSRG